MESTSAAVVEECRKLIRDIPDFPKKGVVFKDMDSNSQGRLQTVEAVFTDKQ